MKSNSLDLNGCLKVNFTVTLAGLCLLNHAMQIRA